MDLIINQPSPDEYQELTDLLLASKNYWGYPDEWFDLWQEEVTAEDIEKREFYVGRLAGEIIFYYSIHHLQGTEYELEDCFVTPNHIGQGYGRVIFDHLLDQLQKRGCTELKIISDPNAAGFYKQMGAVHTGYHPSLPEGRKLPILILTLPWAQVST